LTTSALVFTLSFVWESCSIFSPCMLCLDLHGVSIFPKLLLFGKFSYFTLFILDSHGVPFSYLILCGKIIIFFHVLPRFIWVFPFPLILYGTLRYPFSPVFSILVRRFPFFPFSV
jgi:hypothetical protein